MTRSARRKREPTRQTLIEGCPQHHRSPLGYLEWHAWADARYKRGERQKRCPTCKLWLFPEEFGAAPVVATS